MHDAFRRECRAWLEANAAPRSATSISGVLSILGREVDSEAGLAAARAFQAKAAADGWAAIQWPVEYGGRSASLMDQVIWGQESAAFDVPTTIFSIGISMGGPTVIEHGTDEQKRRWLPSLRAGEEIWCQLFSEPGAGSDLASLRTSAVRDGAEWVVNGQKVWSSGAHYSQWGMLLARTDREAPKHRGITYFLLDMRTPGIDVRPLRQMTGAAHFNEVYFDDVRIPDRDRIGDVNDGWRIAQTTLLNERASIADMLGESEVVQALTRLARAAGADGRPSVGDAGVRQTIADAVIESEIVRYIGHRIVTAIAQGRLPGAEASIAKLAIARQMKRAADAGIRVGGPATVAEPNAWWDLLLAAPALRIAGGSDEIQRNIIGERVLGLPKEPPAP
jgi:alkylation response protein AidB-like acyl-CoA dehydrogenase